MILNKRKRIVFLCSGGGGNLSFIQHAIQYSWLSEAEIVGVLTDRLCPASDYSSRMGLHNQVIEFKDEGQSSLLSALENLKPDLIVTTVHKIIDRLVVERYQNKLINLHYSLLPAFSGLIGAKSVQAALEYPVLFVGVTVHFVNDDIDAGCPLMQGIIALQNEETLESIMPVVFRCGCIALLSTVTSLLSCVPLSNLPTSLNILGRICVFNGGAIPYCIPCDENFWKALEESLYLKK